MTHKEFANKFLSPAIRDKYFKNCESLEETEIYVANFLKTAFSWSESPEGLDYWITIDNKLDKLYLERGSWGIEALMQKADEIIDIEIVTYP